MRHTIAAAGAALLLAAAGPIAPASAASLVTAGAAVTTPSAVETVQLRSVRPVGPGFGGFRGGFGRPGFAYRGGFGRPGFYGGGRGFYGNRGFYGPRYGYYGGRGYGYRRGWYGPGVIGGLAAGAIIGGALAAPYYGYYPYYAPRTVYVAPTGGGSVAYCAQRFQSYDPASGTYLGYDGLRHPCP